MGSLRQSTEVLVIGAGPGGYVAALRAADLGKEVLLVERRERRGGVCLLEGCIPSKTLIHAVALLEETRHAEKMGLQFRDVALDPGKLAAFKRSVVDGLTKGVDGLLKRRGVEVVRGHARFESPTSVALEASDVAAVDFKHCILATGSEAAVPPFARSKDVWTSREALEVPEVPKRLLVIGGGYIGFELGRVYAGLGAEVTLVELLPEFLGGADRDLAAVVVERARKRLHRVLAEAKVTALEKDGGGFRVTVETREGPLEESFDRVLVAVGRTPNTGDLGLEHTKIVLDEKGLVPTDAQCRTAEPTIFAIGDITRGPQLAHKASREAKVAAEVIAGHAAAFDNRAVPAVVFTDPELAWTGLTEAEAREKGLAVKVGVFPLAALGRARTLGRTEGLVKVIAAAESGLVLGVGIAGPNASDLVAEGTLAVEMGATLEDLAATIHPHPTLSEAVMEAAEVAAGTCVHINPPRPKKK
ncbi:MAG: dihydrolipoyl dehydrogenase [Planctomycetes bacterium]|nr:dihydrolipoyl dehydrogenase [Planctomycetota bacterium]